MTIKIKVGTLTLSEARDENLPQEFAAWHQTVRIAPGTYDVFAYIEHECNGAYRVRSLSAQCEGITISSNFRSHMWGTWGKSDNNRNEQPATAHVGLPTYGSINETSLLSQASLCDALVRTEWDPRETDPTTTSPRMWRFTWNAARKPIIIEQSRYGGGLSVAALEDLRRFRVDNIEMTPSELEQLQLSFQHLFSASQLYINETAVAWSRSNQLSYQVTRLA